MYQKSIERLKLFGVLESQLEQWAKDNKVPREITIYSPVTGIVEHKNAIQGKYFKEGQSFFDLVDLASMWVEMDVYEHDSSIVKIGQEVEIEFSAIPGEVHTGKINFIDPIINSKTRTLKVRTTLENPEGSLRPGGDSQRGEILSKQVFEMGYTNLYLVTGYEAKDFKSLPHIKEVLGKAPPF